MSAWQTGLVALALLFRPAIAARDTVVDDAGQRIVLAAPAAQGVVADCLLRVQHDLFDLGGELCIPGQEIISDEFVDRLENALDRFNEPLPALKEFILPSGGPGASACHLARTICRRAERCVWTLGRHEKLNPATPRYLNRLSDLLFVIARVLARAETGSEVLWNRGGLRD